jgi:hypothetical protein
MEEFADFIVKRAACEPRGQQIKDLRQLVFLGSFFLALGGQAALRFGAPPDLVGE